jgi:hypothetical protein
MTWERRHCLKVALKMLLDTGVGVCLDRDIAACARECVVLILLDKILRGQPIEIKKHVAKLLIETDIASIHARKMAFLRQHEALFDNDVFTARGECASCGHRSFDCNPSDEHVYLELQHHYNALVLMHQKVDMQVLGRFGKVCAKLGMDTEAELAIQTSIEKRMPLIDAPPCSCNRRWGMRLDVFWELLETEPLHNMQLIELHFQARKSEIEIQMHGHSKAEVDRILEGEEKRFRMLIKLYPEKFTRAWRDNIVDQLRENPSDVPPVHWFKVDCYCYDMLRFFRLQSPVEVHLETQAEFFNIVMSLPTDVLLERLRNYDVVWAYEPDGKGWVCFEYGLDITLARDRRRIITLISNGLLGCKVLLVVDFSLQDDTEAARFVNQELRELRVEIEEAETIE